MSKRDLAGRNGFTLIEVIVVSVIVAVLAAVAIPMYAGYVRNAKVDLAKNNCQLLGAAVMQAHNRGVDIYSVSMDSIGSIIGMQNPSDQFWAYSISNLPYLGSDAQSLPLTVTATGGGQMAGASVGFSPYKPAASRWTLVLE